MNRASPPVTGRSGGEFLGARDEALSIVLAYARTREEQERARNVPERPRLARRAGARGRPSPRVPAAERRAGLASTSRNHPV